MVRKIGSYVFVNVPYVYILSWTSLNRCCLILMEYAFIFERRLKILIIVSFLYAIFVDKLKRWLLYSDLYWSPSRLIEARAVAAYGEESDSTHFSVSEHKSSIRRCSTVILHCGLCDVLHFLRLQCICYWGTYIDLSYIVTELIRHLFLLWNVTSNLSS
jgi:hypothetical protein